MNTMMAENTLFSSMSTDTSPVAGLTRSKGIHHNIRAWYVASGAVSLHPNAWGTLDLAALDH